MKGINIRIKIDRRINRIIIERDWYDDFWGGVTKFWKLKTFNLEVVNLGSNSGKHAFSYSGLNIKGMNWAVGPQSLVHDLNLLKNYFSFLKKDAIVIIPLCPFSCLYSEYSKESNLKYYTFLHPAMIQGFEEEERIKALKIKDNIIKEMPLLCIKESLKTLRNIFHVKRYKCDYERHAQQFIAMWKKQFCITQLDTPLTLKHKSEQESRAQTLVELVDFCIVRNLRPVLVIPPMHPALSSHFSKEFKENYIYSFIEKANKANVPFYDYMDNKEFSDDKYFSNSFFMSKEGARKFTGTLLKELKIIS